METPDVPGALRLLDPDADRGPPRPGQRLLLPVDDRASSAGPQHDDGHLAQAAVHRDLAHHRRRGRDVQPAARPHHHHGLEHRAVVGGRANGTARLAIYLRDRLFPNRRTSRHPVRVVRGSGRNYRRGHARERRTTAPGRRAGRRRLASGRLARAGRGPGRPVRRAVLAAAGQRGATRPARLRHHRRLARHPVEQARRPTSAPTRCAAGWTRS